MPCKGGGNPEQGGLGRYRDETGAILFRYSHVTGSDKQDGFD